MRRTLQRAADKTATSYRSVAFYHISLSSYSLERKPQHTPFSQLTKSHSFHQVNMQWVSAPIYFSDYKSRLFFNQRNCYLKDKITLRWVITIHVYIILEYQQLYRHFHRCLDFPFYDETANDTAAARWLGRTSGKQMLRIIENHNLEISQNVKKGIILVFICRSSTFKTWSKCAFLLLRTWTEECPVRIMGHEKCRAIGQSQEEWQVIWGKTQSRKREMNKIGHYREGDAFVLFPLVKILTAY